MQVQERVIGIIQKTGIVNLSLRPQLYFAISKSVRSSWINQGLVAKAKHLSKIYCIQGHFKDSC